MKNIKNLSKKTTLKCRFSSKNGVPRKNYFRETIGNFGRCKSVILVGVKMVEMVGKWGLKGENWERIGKLLMDRRVRDGEGYERLSCKKIKKNFQKR